MAQLDELFQIGSWINEEDLAKLRPGAVNISSPQKTLSIPSQTEEIAATAPASEAEPAKAKPAPAVNRRNPSPRTTGRRGNRCSKRTLGSQITSLSGPASEFSVRSGCSSGYASTAASKPVSLIDVRGATIQSDWLTKCRRVCRGPLRTIQTTITKWC